MNKRKVEKRNKTIRFLRVADDMIGEALRTNSGKYHNILAKEDMTDAQFKIMDAITELERN